MSSRALLYVSGLAVCTLSAVAACSSSDGQTHTHDAPPASAVVDGGNVTLPPGQTGGGLPCDVDAVLEKNCRSCHGATPSYGAPMPLVTAEDLLAPRKGKRVIDVALDRIQSEATPMPPPPNARLGASDIASLQNWISGGAPRSTETCAKGPATGAGPRPLSCTPDQHVRPKTKIQVPDKAGTETDFYMCYGLELDLPAKRHIVAAAPFIDNTKVVHHVILFQSDEPVDPTPTPCSQGTGGISSRFITGWAPGGGNLELPAEAGFPEPSGKSYWRVQIHYNQEQALAGQLDESGFDLCTTTELRPNDADVMATGSIQINIPPRSNFTSTCEYTWPQSAHPITVFGGSPHMHRLGRSQFVDRIRGTDVAKIIDVPNFDFLNGGSGEVANVNVNPGDVLRTSCHWGNTGDQTVRLGEGTGDEMCFGFQLYYPKIESANWRWMTPSIAVRCTNKAE